jgi:hypothetical protein
MVIFHSFVVNLPESTILYNVGKTIVKHPPKQIFDRWYGYHSQSWGVCVFFYPHSIYSLTVWCLHVSTQRLPNITAFNKAIHPAVPQRTCADALHQTHLGRSRQRQMVSEVMVPPVIQVIRGFVCPKTQCDLGIHFRTPLFFSVFFCIKTQGDLEIPHVWKPHCSLAYLSQRVG